MRLERLLPTAILALTLVLAGCVTSGGNAKAEKTDADRTHAAEVHTELGQHYMQQGNLKAAMEKLKMALTFDDSYAPAHTVLGVLYERIGDAANAGAQKRRAVELQPKDGATNNNYAVFLCQQGKFDEAMVYFKRAVADPFYATPSAAWTNAGSCMVKAGKYPVAENNYRKALQIDPKNADAMLQLATLLYKEHDGFHARAFLQRYESLTKPDAVSLRLGYDIEIMLGDAEGAQNYARRLRTQFPDSEQAQGLEAKPGS